MSTSNLVDTEGGLWRDEEGLLWGIACASAAAAEEETTVAEVE
jgi:hypothetical protein